MSEAPISYETETERFGREFYPDKATMLEKFKEKVQAGEFVFEQVENASTATLNNQNVIDATAKDERYPGVDFSPFLGHSFNTSSVHEIVDKLDPESASLFKEQEWNRLLRGGFEVGIQQNYGWWLPIGKKDVNEWLDTRPLFGITEVKIGDKPILINDFSGKIDMDAFVEGMKTVTKQLAAKGVNITEVFSAINIMPADWEDFAVPDHIKQKFPDIEVAGKAFANGTFVFNENNINKGFEIESKGFNYASGWGSIFIHETGHLLNFGLSSLKPEHAQAMGWQKRIDVMVDDYGNAIIDTERVGLAPKVTDNYGEVVEIYERILPETLIVEGHRDAEGEVIAPPSDYGHENSSEDIAESFLAYVLDDPNKKQLDTTRKQEIEKIIDGSGMTSLDPEVQITSRPLDLATFDIFDYFPKKITYAQNLAVLGGF